MVVCGCFSGDVWVLFCWCVDVFVAGVWMFARSLVYRCGMTSTSVHPMQASGVKLHAGEARVWSPKASVFSHDLLR